MSPLIAGTIALLFVAVCEFRVWRRSANASRLLATATKKSPVSVLETGVPISRADAESVAKEFRRRWDVRKLAALGLEGLAADTIYALQDSGDVILLTTEELGALTDWMTETEIVFDVYDGVAVKPELGLAVRKVLFAWGRCYGMTNFDMGIEEPDAKR